MGNIQHNGKVYESVMDFYIAEYKGELSYQTIRARILAGWPIEKVLQTPSLEKKKTFTVNGVKYETLKELAAAAGISYMAAVKREHRGFSDHEIFHGKSKIKTETNQTPNRPRGKPVTANGVTYQSLPKAH